MKILHPLRTDLQIEKLNYCKSNFKNTDQMWGEMQIQL